MKLARDVAISLRLFDTLSGILFTCCGSLSTHGDSLAFLRFHANLVYQNGATHNPAILTPFRPSGGSFQTRRSPTTSGLAPKRVPRMGFPLCVPHAAPLDSPIGEWDRRCRIFSQGYPIRPSLFSTRFIPNQFGRDVRTGRLLFQYREPDVKIS